VRRQSEAATALGSEFRVCAAINQSVPPEGGTPNNPKRRRRFALPAHSKGEHHANLHCFAQVD